MSDIVFVPEINTWWPRYETDPVRTDTYIKKRVTDVDITAALCGKRRRTVVQAGGHVGLFPLRLARFFDVVYSFEADPHAFAALVRNTTREPKVRCFNRALGETERDARIALKFRSGAASIDDGNETAVPVQMITIDSLKIKNCDALVLDVEAYETKVLEGAIETIERCNPVIHVEELPRSRDGIQAMLRGLGYQERRRVHGDAIYVRTKS